MYCRYCWDGGVWRRAYPLPSNGITRGRASVANEEAIDASETYGRSTLARNGVIEQAVRIRLMHQLTTSKSLSLL
jgi:hypothetical protein